MYEEGPGLLQFMVESRRKLAGWGDPHFQSRTREVEDTTSWAWGQPELQSETCLNETSKHTKPDMELCRQSVQNSLVFICIPVLWKLTKDRHWSTRGRCYCDKELPPRLTSQQCYLEELGFWHRNFGETCPDHREKQVPLEWPRNHTSFSKELEATLICIHVEHLLWLLSFSFQQRTADAD